MVKTTTDPELKPLLGADEKSTLHENLGFDRKWAYNIAKLVGNYGEIFDRNLGKDSNIKLPRGLNNLYTNGGLLYAPPFK
jgi:general L-amino acid transport system substrate-binding protein